MSCRMYHARRVLLVTSVNLSTGNAGTHHKTRTITTSDHTANHARHWKDTGSRFPLAMPYPMDACPSMYKPTMILTVISWTHPYDTSFMVLWVGCNVDIWCDINNLSCVSCPSTVMSVAYVVVMHCALRHAIVCLQYIIQVLLANKASRRHEYWIAKIRIRSWTVYVPPLTNWVCDPPLPAPASWVPSLMDT